MYAGKLAALIVALSGLGAATYYSSHAISGGRQGENALVRVGNAAVVLQEGGGVATPGGSCGKERWAVKTLTDPAATAVDLTPIPSTITELGSLAAPAAASDLPRQPQEQNVYTVEGTIVAFKLEADSDIHLAIADPAPGPHATMIAEFPASYCDTGAVDEAQIDQARRDFIAVYGQPTPRFQTPTGCVTLTGVFFFDRIHGQFGVALNGAELHPVINVQNGCNPTATTPTATTTATTTTTTATTTGVPTTTSSTP